MQLPVQRLSRSDRVGDDEQRLLGTLQPLRQPQCGRTTVGLTETDSSGIGATNYIVIQQ